jgi:hypothetical protein
MLMDQKAKLSKLASTNVPVGIRYHLYIELGMPAIRPSLPGVVSPVTAVSIHSGPGLVVPA